MKNKQAFQQQIADLLSRNGDNQVVMGLTGGSGSGKTTISEIIKRKLSDFHVNIVHLDQFFYPVDEMPKYFSKYLGKSQPNFNRPEAINFQSMVAFCSTLPKFDLHIFDGHFALYNPLMRALMDVKCFITIDIHEMLDRRTIRNLKNSYGGDEANIRNYNMECVVPMYQQYILPCKEHADVIIPNSSVDIAERDQIIEMLCTSIAEKFKDGCEIM